MKIRIPVKKPSKSSTFAKTKAAVPAAIQEEKDAQAVPVVVRIPTELLNRIDHAVANRPVRIPRHTWLLEAVVEKLDRLK